MLDSSTMTFAPFKDNRAKKDPRFVGMSGRLLLGTDASGKKYLIKHTYAHNAANEYTACWLAEKMGIIAPKAYLLTKARCFASRYAVAIEYFDSLQYFSKDDMKDVMTGTEEPLPGAHTLKKRINKILEEKDSEIKIQFIYNEQTAHKWLIVNV